MLREIIIIARLIRPYYKTRMMFNANLILVVLLVTFLQMASAAKKAKEADPRDCEVVTHNY